MALGDPIIAGKNTAHIYNVKDYGATRDGVTDDIDAINAAITAAVAAGIGTVFFPSGKYRISSAINVTAGSVSLAGESAVTSILLADGAGVYNMVYITGGNYTNIKDLGFWSDNGTKVGINLAVGKGGRSTYSDLSFIGNLSSCIIVHQSSPIITISNIRAQSLDLVTSAALADMEQVVWIETSGSTNANHNPTLMNISNINAFGPTRAVIYASGRTFGDACISNINLDGNRTGANCVAAIYFDGGNLYAENVNISGVHADGVTTYGVRLVNFSDTTISSLTLGGYISAANGVSIVNGTGISYLSEDGLYTTGSLTKGSGSFKITHPLDNKKWLYHSFIEGPKADLVYRGKVKLINGMASVSIDKSSNMTTGTFAVLTQDPQVFLQNLDGWSQVRGRILGGSLTIESRSNCSEEIGWLIVAERADPFIKNWGLTDDNGHLIPEWSKEDN